MRQRIFLTFATALLVAGMVVTGAVPQPIKTALAQACQGAGICFMTGKPYFSNGIQGFAVDPSTPTQIVALSTPIAPLGFHQAISSTGSVTITLSVSPVNTCSVFTNVGSQNIIFADTGTMKLSGNQTVGTTDSIGLCSNGTNWYEFTESDN